MIEQLQDYLKNEGLRNAIYLGKWYTYDLKTQKLLIIIMERAKVPMILTTGKMVNLTLESFQKMVKTIYSFVTVLKNFQ